MNYEIENYFINLIKIEKLNKLKKRKNQINYKNIFLFMNLKVF